MFECPACGAALKFDIASQKLHCEYCDSFYDPAAFESGSGAEESDEFGVTVYTCSQCGAELVSTDNSATGFCSYCGASTMLESRLGTEKKPDYITPFQITKEDCKKAYGSVLKHAWYAPKELRDPEFLERFRGIYMPYWLYRIHFNRSVTLPASKSEHRGNYTYEREYDASCSLNGTYENIPYDASSSFDDTIAKTIAPFSAKKMKPFKPAYLAGFYADTADVDKVTYRQDAIDQAGAYAMSKVTRSLEKGGYSVTVPNTPEMIEKTLGTKCDYPQGAFLPVWFLTWRKKDRVAYAIVNGETGKVSADLPVDTGRYLLGTVLLAAVLFLIANFFISMTAPAALMIASVLALVSSILFYFELRSIMRRENHIEDMGYFARSENEKSLRYAREEAEKNRKKQKKGSGLKNAAGYIVPIFMFAIFAVPFSLAFVAALLSSIGRPLVSIIVCCAGAVVLWKSIRNIVRVKEKGMILPAISAFAGEVICLILTLTNAFEDWQYYAGAAICLLAVLLTSVELIRRRNLLATRAVPTLFEREGGNDRAEKDGSGALGSVQGILIIALLSLSLLCSGIVAHADTARYTNAETGYPVYLSDGADLLTDSEEAALVEDMKSITGYGGVGFVTGYYYGQETSDAAREQFRSWFGTGSGTLFMIDMGNRNIYIFSDGAIYRIVNKSYANTITDNVYRSASRAEYYACAKEAFSEIEALLAGGKISQPMKYICNALIALILSLLINYALVVWSARIAKPSKEELLGAMTVGFVATGRRLVHLRTTKHFTGSSDGGGGGGGGGFSGGGGGGGSSGGGGGHGF